MIHEVNAINEFQSLHNSINERIASTYLISNKLHDYLEKRMILDYHFRGEQDKMETEHPELKEKALKMMGPVFYYDLTSNNLPLNESSESF